VQLFLIKVVIDKVMPQNVKITATALGKLLPVFGGQIHIEQRPAHAVATPIDVHLSMRAVKNFAANHLYLLKSVSVLQSQQKLLARAVLMAAIKRFFIIIDKIFPTIIIGRNPLSQLNGVLPIQIRTKCFNIIIIVIAKDFFIIFTSPFKYFI